MADVTLTSIAAANAVSGVQGANAANPTGGGAANSPTLPAGSLIQGYVLNRDAQGNPILRTSSGDYLVQSNYFLKIGSDVVARVNGSGSTQNASILSVDGHSPQEAETLPAQGDLASVIIGNDTESASPQTAPNTPVTTEESAAPAASPAVLRGTAATITGTLTQPAPPSAEENAAPLPAGTQLTFQIVNVVPPPEQVAEQATQAPQADATATALAVPTAPAAPAAPAPATPANASAQLYSAYTRSATLTLQGAQPAASVANTPAAPAATAQASAGADTQRIVQAEIMQTAPGAPATVQTPLGTVQLDNAPALPAGSRLTLALLQTAAPAAGATEETGAAPASIATLSASWQSLGQIMDTMAKLDESTTANFARMAMPASAFGPEPTATNLYPSPQDLSSGLFFFMNALGSGNFRGWLGNRAADLLEEHGHAALIEQAEAEWSAMRGLYTDAKPQNWQALFLPIMAEGQVKTLRLYTKREKKGKERGKPGQGDTRFIVEMELSACGQMQLDGLVRKREGNTQFDLMIRSRKPFDMQAQHDIQIIYHSVGEATGFKGMVMFQQVNEFSIKPLDEILAEQHREVTA